MTNCGGCLRVRGFLRSSLSTELFCPLGLLRSKCRSMKIELLVYELLAF